MKNEVAAFRVWLDTETYPDLKFPVRKHEDDAGWDVHAAVDYKIITGQRAVIETGVYIELKPGWECQVRSRSGLAAKNGIFVLNSPGTIDSGYRDSIKVILHNTTTENFWVKKGDRIAQLVFKQVPFVDLVLSNEKFSIDTERGLGGLGSTGVK